MRATYLLALLGLLSVAACGAGDAGGGPGGDGDGDGDSGPINDPAEDLLCSTALNVSGTVRPTTTLADSPAGTWTINVTVGQGDCDVNAVNQFVEDQYVYNVTKDEENATIITWQANPTSMFTSFKITRQGGDWNGNFQHYRNPDTK